MYPFLILIYSSVTFGCVLMSKVHLFIMLGCMGVIWIMLRQYYISICYSLLTFLEGFAYFILFLIQ